jgi:peptide/nickel transport system substrate-binding protein
MVLRDSNQGGPRTFNRFISTESGSANTVVGIEEALGAGLLTIDPVTDAWIPYAAESFDVSEDGTVIDVTLREGLMWSDGTPITLDDYLLTYEIETDPELDGPHYDGWFIDGEQITVEATGERSLRFTFPAPDRIAFTIVGTFIPTPSQIFADVYAEGGADAVEGILGTETDPSELVFSAPWVLSDYVPDERLVFTRNPHFGEWNVDEAGNPLPYISQRIETIADQQAQLNLYLAGEIDLYNPANLDEVGAINVAAINGDINATILENVSPVRSSSFFVFNWNLARDPFKQDVFRDARFRQAMSHLTDREAIVELVNGGAAAPAFSNVYQVLEFWYNPDVPRYDFDPEAALALLAEMGFTETNEDGFLVDADGNELGFTLSTNAGNANREQTLQIIADTMREYGINVNAVTLDFNLLVDQILSEGDDRPWEAILIGSSGGSRDWPFGTNTYVCTGNFHMYNRSGACLTEEEEQMQALFFEGRSTLDNERAQEIAYELQNVHADLQPIIYTVSPLAHYSWLERLGGNYPDELIDTINGSRALVLSFVRE